VKPLKVRVYSKRECHLCDVAKEVLARVARKYPLQIEDIDIEKNPADLLAYQYEIPVVFLEDQKLFKFRVDETKLVRAIRRRLK
jgi:glutaredoxin